MRVGALARLLTNQELTSDRDRVYEAADIVEIATVYTALKQRAGKHVGLCPFHHEKTPSFSVDRARKLYHCFGCHQGGDVFRLVMEMERFSFVEALKFLAERYNIELVGGRGNKAASSERKRLIEVHALANGFYQRVLQSPDGREAREFLLKRGVKAEAVAALHLGYAPPQWDRLYTHLRREGVPDDHILKAGLSVQRQGSGSSYYDRFRDRVIFPIISEGGEVIAFGGRVLPREGDSAGSPKFINSPETSVYSKGKQFYGLNLTRDQIRKSGEAVIVEGYMDFVLLYQEGVKNCVASLGTSLTRLQVRLLERHGAAGILNFDPDTAGREAVIRSLQTFFEEDVGVRVMALPDGLDPDEFILQQGLQAYVELIRNAPAGEVFALDSLFSSYAGHEGQRRVQDITDFLKLCRSISNQIRLELALREASARFGMSIGQLYAEMQKLPQAAVSQAEHPQAVVHLARPSPAEVRLVLFCAAGAENYKAVANGLAPTAPALTCKSIFQKLETLAGREGAYDRERIFSVLDSAEAAQLSRILMEHEDAGIPDLAEAKSCLEALRNETGEAARLQSAVEKAQNDPDQLTVALARKQEYMRKLHAVAK